MVIRKNVGPTKSGQSWRIRHNKVLYDIFKKTEIRIIRRIAKLTWAGHMIRMEDSEMPKKVHKREGKRGRGRP